LASNRADQPLHKRMGERTWGTVLISVASIIRRLACHCPNRKRGSWSELMYLGIPLPSNGAIEHPTECDTVDGSGMDAEPNDPAGILIHHGQNPVGPQGGRFAPEQIQTPETVFHVANEGQPR